MKKAEDIGTNRTGIATSPIDGPQVISGAEQGSPSTPGDESAQAAVRAAYVKESEPIGSVPPPASIKGAVKTIAQALKGEKASVFIDKLGERMAFERAGVRLYELAIVKAQSAPRADGAPSAADLATIQRDELEHFGMLVGCAKEIGADPTVMTPSADIAANLSVGVRAVLADPRTDLRQCLEALLVAELADNAGWELLIALARELGQEQMVTRFERALDEEVEHLARVKTWLQQGVIGAAAIKPERNERRPGAH
jgi:tRNA isopentenyl-2-thiomethyl-A-37 hydroxylase MiaE